MILSRLHLPEDVNPFPFVRRAFSPHIFFMEAA